MSNKAILLKPHINIKANDEVDFQKKKITL